MALFGPGFGWDPFSEMRRLQTEMNRVFDGAGAAPSARADPPVNLWLGESSIVVTAALPGVAPADVDLSIMEDRLTIRGERRPPEDEVAWIRRERPAGPFARTVNLPFRVDADRAQARFTEGVLEVELPRPEADRPRSIEIAAADEGDAS